MRRFLAIALLILAAAALPAAAQISYDTVSATITSQNGFPYANARYSFQLVSAQGYPIASAVTPNGQIYTAKLIQGEADADGTFSASVPPNTLFTSPLNTHWHLTISHPAEYYILHENDIHYWTINYDVTVTGNVDLSSQLSALSTDISFANLRTNQNTFSGSGSGFPITLGSTSIAAGSATTALNGLTVNGVDLNSTGSSALFLNQAGGYSAPAGSTITWPTTGDLVLSNDTNSPAGLAPVNGDCVVGSGGAWTAGGCSGSTPSALTAAASGGATPGSTFNGSSPVTFDYHSFGAQQALTLTTVGSSGAATLSAGALNIPNYSGGSSSGVQYNPTTTAYVFSGSSINQDDNRTTSSAITVASWTCNGTTCTVTTSAAHGLVAGDWVDVSAMTSWFSTPAGLTSQDSGVGTFEILSTGLTSTQFEFAYTTNSGSGTGGSVYSASYWGPYLASKMPYLNGHGSVYWRFAFASDCANPTTFTTKYGSISGSPKYFIFNGAQNDLNAGDTDTAIEASLQACWQNAHNAGFIVLQTSIVPTSIGLPPANYGQYNETVNQWLWAQAKTYFNASNGEYFDKFIDLNSFAMSMGNLNTIEGNSASGGAYFAERVNEAFGTQGGSVNGPPPLINYNLSTEGVDFWTGTNSVWMNGGWNFLDTSRFNVLHIGAIGGHDDVNIQTGNYDFGYWFAGITLEPRLTFGTANPISMGVGTDGSLDDDWFAYAASDGAWFTNSLTGDSATVFHEAGHAWLIGTPNSSTNTTATASFFNNHLCIGTRACPSLFTVTGQSSLDTILPTVFYSAAGTALPSCASGSKGDHATVSDATAPTYMGAYTSGGAITADVICSYNGTTYSWLTH